VSLFSRSIRFGAVKAVRLLKCEHMSLRYCIPAARTQCPQAGRPSNNRSFCARLPQRQTNFDHAPPFGNLRCTTATTNSTPLSPLSNRMVAALVSGPISPIACNRDARTTGLRLDDCPFCWAAGRRCDDAESKSWSTSSTAATVRCSTCGKTQSRRSSMS
jgi:hypothetical protein